MAVFQLNYGVTKTGSRKGLVRGPWSADPCSKGVLGGMEASLASMDDNALQTAMCYYAARPFPT